LIAGKKSKPDPTDSMKILHLSLLLSTLVPVIASGAKPNVVIIFMDDTDSMKMGARQIFSWVRNFFKSPYFFCCNVYGLTYTLPMKTNSTSGRIAQLAAITRMERGHLSVIRTGPDGQPYYNLQHRENGRNVTEYIPRDQVATVEENIAAYERFKTLIDEHVDEISEQSRQERKADVKKKRRTTKPSTSPGTKKSKS
jgi:hypothetical protein